MEKLISWVEIPTADFHRAVKFYSTVFKIELQAIDCGVEKMACFPTGEGAVIFAPGYEPSASGVLVSFNVPDDLEQTLGRITTNGGKIVRPKTKIEAEGRGYFAVFSDCEGNRVGLYGES